MVYEHMTSYIKPEVRNISIRRQRRTEPLPWITRIKKIGDDRTFSSEDIIADRHRQTDTLIAILRSAIQGAVTIAAGRR